MNPENRIVPWKIAGIALVLLFACVLPFTISNYSVFQCTLVLVYAIALLGLNMLTGFNGQISLGHGAFYAIGAYVAAIMMDKFGVPYWATPPAAGAVCLVAGFLFGLPALRLEGLYLALATYALGVSMPQLLKYKGFEHWTGGVEGIVIIKPDPPAGVPLTQDQWLYFFTLAVCIVMFVLGWNLLRGRVGRAMIAIRDQPIAAEAMGVNNAMYKSLTFGVSAMYTGVAGALGAIAVQFVAPDSFSIFLSISPAGGHGGGRTGVDLGRRVRRDFHPVRAQHRRPDSKAAPWAIYGVFLIGFMYLMPGGIAGFVRFLAAHAKRRLNANSHRDRA
ncbi:MAG: branched-chain amino acid ABC transporter permease [Rhodospirillales bacterium]